MDLPESLLQQYIANRVKDYELICELLDKEDLESCAALGHRLKGSGPAYGFQQLGDIGIAMQAAARDRNLEELKQQVQLLAQWLESRRTG